MKGHKNNKTRISYANWGHILTRGCAHNQYGHTAVKLAHCCQIQKKIPRAIAACIDEIDLAGETGKNSSTYRPPEEDVKIVEEFESLQRTTFENLLSTVMSIDSWHQDLYL